MGDSISTRGRILKLIKLLKRKLVLSQIAIVFLVIVVLALSFFYIYYSQVDELIVPIDLSGKKESYEIAKLAAEVRQLRSDTSGSLFALKVIALFVTVGGAVGGYLVGQSRNTQKRIDFEKKKSVDEAYQSIVKELSEESSILRATAAVKLGAILKSFPEEWDVKEERKQQMVRLTKEVLAAALAIEDDAKVLKTLTIALVLHKPWQDDPKQRDYRDARELDLSEVKANYAYWAKVDFSYTDFYKAKLAHSSLRRSILNYAQFYFTDLSEAVLSEAQGEDTNFKFADLRSADLTGAKLIRPNFEGAKVYGAKLSGEISPPGKQALDAQVDISEEGNGSQMISVQNWLTQSGIFVTYE